MLQYKTVHVPSIKISHDGNSQDALKQFQACIEKEATDGWELVTTHTITITQEPEPVPAPGCLKGLLILVGAAPRPEAPKAKTFYIDMLVLARKA